jgi:hypothetical protein
MKISPTLERGLRIDVDGAADWDLLRTIVIDANGTDLASRLGGLISAEAGADDWHELVVPDLREGFRDHIAEVGASIESAVNFAGGGAGPLWITPEDAFAWYSSLNQARLGLEEIFRFGADERIVCEGEAPERALARVRSRFYCAIQALLLEYVLQ